MIEFKPAVNEELLKSLNLDEKSGNTVCYTAYEGGSERGYCVCLIENTSARIIFLQFSDETPYVGEGLIKSVLNYAAGKGAYIAQCSEDVRKNHVLPYGFNLTDNGYTGEIPEILMGKCLKFGNL